MSDWEPGGAGGRRRWPWVVLVVVLALSAGGAAAVEVVSHTLARDGTKRLRIGYEVSGTAEEVTVTYPAWRDGELSTARMALRSLPWAGETESKGFMRGGAFTATVGRSGGTVVCTVTVDDGTVRRASASGAFATATCAGF
ncbi:hypothetical protein [Streptomyces sp. NPDC014734]|uniref:hypothetical protein n=1 Tax=Streptomyces sp. NPDC014734 TaxID=3364886 RepID=UPI0036FC5848